MPDDRAPKQDADGGERRRRPRRMKSRAELGDDQIAGMLIWEERAPKVRKRPWWVRLMSWLRTKGDDSYG
jgi:hypothetical protein